MYHSLLIMAGGGVGSMLRYWLAIATYFFLGSNFPYGTLTVNVVGCFCAGLLSVLLIERLSVNTDTIRALLLIGFLGGFTTFSAFSIETFYLFENGELMKALLNIFCSLSFCLVAVSLGALLGRQF